MKITMLKGGQYMDINARCRQLSSLKLENYEIIKTEALEDLNSAGLLLKHKKSGARLAVISNEDDNKVFSIGFKTPAYNDTGLQHILEHSVLCGSRKYPVRIRLLNYAKVLLTHF